MVKQGLFILHVPLCRLARFRVRVEKQLMCIGLKGNLFSTLAGYARISDISKSRKLIGKSGEPCGILVVVGNESVRKLCNVVVGPPRWEA